jgi:hypothetical protein
MRLAYKYLLIVGINLLCYYQSLDGEFVFDDSVAILKNRDVYEGELDWKKVEVKMRKVELKSLKVKNVC